MRMMFAVVFACIILAFTASGVAGGVEVGDWLSGGYVVTGYNLGFPQKESPLAFWISVLCCNNLSGTG